ncbi:dihydroxyacetone kinase subunit DhaK [Ignatzschineria sp. LJL83]
MKAFINPERNVVNDAVEGLLVDDRLAVLDQFPEVRVVVRRDWQKDKVALISGGGSGHEPAHAGFVGKGMLTAAVCGDVFASPTVDAVLSAILAVTGEKGSLVIIKNYTGDRLNFGLAVEQARALGYKVESITVGDDVALGDDVQKRGIAGTLFVHKVAGYLAEAGFELSEIVEIVQNAVNNIMTLGMAVTECQMFNSDKACRLKENEAELGLGIHGEAGTKIIPYANADTFMQTVSDQLNAKVQEKIKDAQSGIQADTRYALLLNNLGSVTPLEMNVLLHAFTKTALAEKVQYITGPAQYMTALNMAGFSLSIIALDEMIETALLADVEPVAWQKVRSFCAPHKIASPTLPAIYPYAPSEDDHAKAVILNATNTFIAIKDEMNALDAKVGDGDAGETFAFGAQKIQEAIDQLPLADGAELLETIGRVLAREAGGSSGVLLSILFTAAAVEYQQDPDYGKALLAGLAQMKHHGGADVGDRTMIDALEPAFIALANGESLEAAAIAARKGSESTKFITKTLFGRSSYIPESELKNIPDPGAEAMARAFEGLLK